MRRQTERQNSSEKIQPDLTSPLGSHSRIPSGGSIHRLPTLPRGQLHQGPSCINSPKGVGSPITSPGGTISRKHRLLNQSNVESPVEKPITALSRKLSVLMPHIAKKQEETMQGIVVCGDLEIPVAPVINPSEPIKAKEVHLPIEQAPISQSETNYRYNDNARGKVGKLKRYLKELFSNY